MKKLFAFFMFILFYVATGLTIETGSKGLSFLNIVPNARGSALGEAFIAQIDDVSTIYWNPAGLSALNNMEVGVNFLSYIENMSYINLQAAKNFSFGGFGLNITSFNYGDIENYVDGTLAGTFTPSDILASIGYSMELFKDFHFGIGLKFISEKLTENYSGSGIGADIGLLYINPLGTLVKRNFIKPLRIGFVIQNIGSGPKFITEATPMPLSIKFGLAYKYRFPISVAKLKDINFLLDLAPVSHTGFGISYGTEFWWYNLPAGIDAALRIGVKMPQDLGFLSSLRMGAGIRIFGAEFDYTFLNLGDLGISHQLSLSYKFGKIVKPVDVKREIEEKTETSEKELKEEETEEEELIEETPEEQTLKPVNEEEIKEDTETEDDEELEEDFDEE